MFSEYYFYLTTFIDDEKVRQDFDGINDSFPTIYRIDRIEKLEVLEERFHIPYSSRFEEGELLSDEIVSLIKKEFENGDYSNPDYYETYWDTDSMEMNVGTDFRGRTKYAECALYRVNDLVTEYNENLSQSLQKRIAYVEKKLDSIL